MGDAAPAAAPTAAPAPSAPASGAQPTAQPAAQPSAQARETPSPSATPTRPPVLIKHKAKIAGPDGAEAEHELDIDIAEHIHAMKHKIKSDGAERELTLAELLERAPLADGAFRRMREAAAATKERDTLKKQVEGLVEHLKNPAKVREILARTLGPQKARDLVEQWQADFIAEERMTPAEREKRARETETERRLREREEKVARDEAALREREEARVEAETKQIRERFMKEWPGHLERAGIKPTERAIRMMAQVHREARNSKFTLTDEQAAREVAKEYAEHLGEQGKQLPSTAAAQLAEIEAQPGRTALPRTPTGQFAPSKQPPPATLEEYRQRQRDAAEEAYQASLRKR